MAGQAFAQPTPPAPLGRTWVGNQPQDPVLLEVIQKLADSGVPPETIAQIVATGGNTFGKSGPVQLQAPAIETPPTERSGASPWYKNPHIVNQDVMSFLEQNFPQGGGEDPATRAARLAPELAPSQTHPDPTQQAQGQGAFDSVIAWLRQNASTLGRGPTGFGQPFMPGNMQPPSIGGEGQGAPTTGGPLEEYFPHPNQPARPAPGQQQPTSPTVAAAPPPGPPQLPGAKAAPETPVMQRGPGAAAPGQPGFSDYSWDDLLSFGLNLMAASEPQRGDTRRPSLLGAVGRAGSATVSNKQAQRQKATELGLKQQEIDIAGTKVLLDAENTRLLREIEQGDRQIQRAIQAANLSVDAQQAIAQVEKEYQENMGNALARAATTLPEGMDLTVWRNQLIQDFTQRRDAGIAAIMQSASPFMNPALPQQGGARNATSPGGVPVPGAGGVNSKTGTGDIQFVPNRTGTGMTAGRLPSGQYIVPGNP